MADKIRKLIIAFACLAIAAIVAPKEINPMAATTVKAIDYGHSGDSYTGMCYKDSTLWYEKDGKIDYSYSGICSDEDWDPLRLYYVVNGKYENYIGPCKYNGYWYYVNGGTVDESYTGLYEIGDDLYYLKKGKEDNTYI